MTATKAIASAIILGITAGVCLLYLTGCTSTQFSSDHFKLSRVSLFQQVQAQTVTINADGTATLSGYGNDGGASAVAAAVTAAIHAIK